MGFKSKGSGKTPKKEKGDKPVFTIRAPHGLQLSVWENEYDKFTAYSCRPSRSYYDDEKKAYEETTYLRADDLLAMAAMCAKAWEKIREQAQEDGKTKDDKPDTQQTQQEKETGDKVGF